MVVFKFQKTSTSALAAHVDTLRAITYIFRRANLQVQYSEGYNPHMELGFSAPLALGTESLCEYVSAKMQYSDDLLPRLNAVCPKGLRFVAVFQKQVNLAAAIDSARYLVRAQGIGDVVEEILAQGYTIEVQSKGKTTTQQVDGKIFEAKRLDANTAEVVLAMGNNNLRPDKLVRHLMNKHSLAGDYSVTKINCYAKGVPADEFLAAD